MASTYNEWPDHRTELLKKLFAEGLSYGLIRQQMPEMTRSAIVAKARRLKLPSRIGVEPKQRKPFRNGHTTPRRPNNNLIVTNMRRRAPLLPADELPRTLADDLEIPVEQRRGLLQLNNHTCRWPVGNPGEPGFFFCGGKPAKGFPYCAGHARVAYTKAPRSEPVTAFKIKF